MWAWKNLNVLFYYQDNEFEVGGELLGSNIPYTIEIQTP
jgi:hypothetical protein